MIRYLGSIAGTRLRQGISPKLCSCSVHKREIAIGRRFGERKCQNYSLDMASLL